MENKSEREDHNDVDNQSDVAEEWTPEVKIAEIDTLVSEGCVCSNENYFSVLVAQSIVTIQHQVCEGKSDIFLLVLVNNMSGQPMPAAPHERFTSAHTYLPTSSCMFYSL